MASSSVSSMILFIAAMLIAASVAGTLVTSVSDVSGSIDTRSADAAKKIDTEIDVISDPGSDAVYDGSNTVTLLVKNTGSESLPADASAPDVLVDGQYVTASDRTLTVLGGGDWRPEDVARLELTTSLSPGEHRVVVVVNGDREVFEFYV